MAKGGRASSEPESSRVLAKLAQEMFAQTAPLRAGEVMTAQQDQAILGANPNPWQLTQRGFSELADRSNKFVAGDLDVTQSPIWGAVKGGIDQEYAQARDLLLSQVPRGGAQASGMADLAGERADALARARGDLAQQELGRAMAMAQLGLADRADTQARVTGLASMGGIDPGSALAQSAAAQSAAMQANAQRSAGKGSALGSLGAAAIKRI